jgi:Spy/CpxP family protein refolding chaperone
MRRLLFAHLAAAAIAVPLAVQAQHASAPPPPAPAGQSRDLQGGVQAEFMAHPRVREFYELSAAMLRGKGPVDVDAYEQKSFAIFRKMGEEMGMGAAAMQDHLKLIPRQVAQIAKEDPHALDSFETFSEAMIGPP